LTRQRAQQVAEKAAANRTQKAQDGAHVKQAGVATDVPAASGRARLEALIAGEEDPGQLAELPPAAAAAEDLWGVDQRTAEVASAETGADRERPPPAGHLASWAGTCSGKESAGKRKSGQTTEGGPLAASGAEASGVGGRPRQGDVPGGAAPAAGGAAGGRSARCWRWAIRCWGSPTGC
jgi:hypothetical protein